MAIDERPPQTCAMIDVARPPPSWPSQGLYRGAVFPTETRRVFLDCRRGGRSAASSPQAASEGGRAGSDAERRSALEAGPGVASPASGGPASSRRALAREGARREQPPLARASALPRGAALTRLSPPVAAAAARRPPRASPKADANDKDKDKDKDKRARVGGGGGGGRGSGKGKGRKGRGTAAEDEGFGTWLRGFKKVRAPDRRPSPATLTARAGAGARGDTPTAQALCWPALRRARRGCRAAPCPRAP